MADEQTTPDSSPLADSLVDFNSLGGVPTDAPASGDTPAAPAETSFLDDFNKEVAPEPEKPAESDTPPATEEEPLAVEEDDIDAIKPPEKASSAAKESFQKIKDSAKSYKQKFEAAEKLRSEELAARDTELAELRAKVAELPELSERAKFAEEAEKELAIARVEGTREYKATILAPIQAIEDAAIAIAKANEVNPDDVLDAITEPDPTKRRELLKAVVAGLDEIDKQEVIRMAGDTQVLLQKREAIRANAAEARKEQEELTRQNETKAQKKAREAFEAEAANTVGELKKRLPFLALADGETPDGVFDGILAKARSTDLDSAPVANKAFAVAAALALPRMAKQFLKLQEENKTLRTRIAESNTSRATVSDTSAPAKTDGDDFFGNLGIADPAAGISRLK